MRRVIGYVVIAIFVALLITGATFFVGEGVEAPVPGYGAGGGGTTATVSGFPIPYVTSFPCCIGTLPFRGGYTFLNNTYYYPHPLNFVADFTIWLAISLAVVFTFSLATLMLAAVAGLGITLLTLLLPPLSIVRPGPSLEIIMRPMGFPYEYLTYEVIYLHGANPRYEFAFSPALADYALWAGVACALIGIAFRILRGRHVKPLNSDSRPS